LTSDVRVSVLGEGEEGVSSVGEVEEGFSVGDLKGRKGGTRDGRREEVEQERKVKRGRGREYETGG